jgi:hypothetical protein
MVNKDQVHISKLGGKLEDFQAVSTNTVTNSFCIKMNSAKKNTICSHCYSHKSLGGYRKNMQEALQRNSDLLSKGPLKKSQVPFINAAYFRFQAHGELINAVHYHNLIKITRANPRTTFALWTKRRDIVTTYSKRWGVPDNLILVYSNPDINKVWDGVPRFFHRVFNNVTDEYKGEANCTGQKCKDCLLCYQFDTTKTIIEHVK